MNRTTIVLWGVFAISPLLLAEQMDLKKRADAGDAAAQYEYSCALSEGKGGAIDLTSAMRYATMAATQNYGLAYHAVAVGYENGWDGKSNRIEAGNWYKKFENWILNEKKDPQASWLFKNGGCEIWLVKAARLGNVCAMDDLARGYQKGDLGLKVDRKKSLFWLYALSKQPDVEDKLECRKIKMARYTIKQVNSGTISGKETLHEIERNFKEEMAEELTSDRLIMEKMKQCVRVNDEIEKLESFCGVKFGAALEKYGSILNHVVRTDDGKFLTKSIALEKPFRGIGKATVYAGVSSHKIFKVSLNWTNDAEKFKDGKEVNAIKSALNNRYGSGKDEILKRNVIVEVMMGYSKEKKWCNVYLNRHEIGDGEIDLSWAEHVGGGYDYEHYNVVLEAVNTRYAEQAEAEFKAESGGDGSGVL